MSQLSQTKPSMTKASPSQQQPPTREFQRLAVTKGSALSAYNTAVEDEDWVQLQHVVFAKWCSDKLSQGKDAKANGLCNIVLTDLRESLGQGVTLLSLLKLCFLATKNWLKFVALVMEYGKNGKTSTCLINALKR